MPIWVRGPLVILTVAMLFITTITATEANSQGELVIGPEQIWRAKFIIFPNQWDALSGDERWNLLNELGISVRHTSDIVMLKKGGCKIAPGKERPIGEVVGLRMRALQCTLDRFGGVLLSFDSYTHEVYIGEISSDDGGLTFLQFTGGGQFEAKNIPLEDIAAVNMTGGAAEIIPKEGARETGILISPFKIKLVPEEGAVTGRIANEKIEIELNDPENCPNESAAICEISPEDIFMVNFGDGEDRMVLKTKAQKEPKKGRPEEGRAKAHPEEGPGQPGVGTGISRPFNFTPLDPKISEQVNFEYPEETLYGEKIVSWEWDFGDGTSSTEQSPTHTYDKSQRYIVCMTITNGKGQSDQTCRAIYVWIPGKIRNTYIKIRTADQDQTLVEIPIEDIDWIMIHTQPAPFIGLIPIITPY